eukprot:CAMPEP_0204831004 /NCGR_PEP_ID=MMETSP1346-20131115/9633_1 /ASSEMBLY_ACC=CAM_ASM_000771 /TAXON_ID=215587 /ORGANISM="Aplanochytrium stocchinoi, Strain GSBS06" /LENGTH=33 /DNA_ID= /DNA_START= /DNA_END= /DNA_ORIENTATION=
MKSYRLLEQSVAMAVAIFILPLEMRKGTLLGGI